MIDKKQLFNLVITSLLVGAPAMAADPGPIADADSKITASKKLDNESCKSGQCGPGHRMNFSDAQLEKMNSLKNKYMDDTSGQKAQLGVLFRQMHEILSKTDVDRQQAVAVQSKINTIHNDLSSARLNFKLDSIAVLTPEQREQMHHKMLQHGGFGGGGHHRGGHGGHGQHHFGHGKPGPGGPGGPGSKTDKA